MARGKIRTRDIVDNMIDTNKIINGTIQIEDLKIQDVGDSTAIVAETIPYVYNVPGVSIWDKIETIIAATGFGFDEWTSSAASTDYTLSGSKQFDTTKLLAVFYNGQFMKQGATDDYDIVTVGVADDTIQFNFTIETGYQIYVIYEAL